MKTKAMKHQVLGTGALKSHDRYAMGAEQGTGKTWMLLADAESRFLSGTLDAVLVIAPKGVHTNWIKREIPTHLSAPHTSTFWLSGAPKKHLVLLEKQLKAALAKTPRQLHIHAVNYDAVITKNGDAHIQRFLKAFDPSRVDIIADESQFIKNPKAQRTKKVKALMRRVKVRRISSGTLVADSPVDLFAQYDVLADGLLGTTSYRAFVAQYAELVPDNSPLTDDIRRRSLERGGRGSIPQIIQKDINGNPKYKNLDKLTRLMAPHTFRVTKDQCLDLPEKIYQTIYFELLPEQRRAYEQVLIKRNWLRADGTIDNFTALTVITKLRQITSGFILVDGEPAKLSPDLAAPRMEALCTALESNPGQAIIWASFQEEIRQISDMLRDQGATVAEYYGKTKDKAREAAIDNFQAGKIQYFVGNQGAAGTGLTLTAARTAVYYSNDFALLRRSQSEDRSHRKGTKHSVLYLDLIGRDTIDERIVAALVSKKITAELIMGPL